MEHTRFEASLSAMHRIGAMTMHLVAGRPPCVRVQRRLVELDAQRITAAEVDEFVRDLLFADHRQTLAARGQVEVLYMGRDGSRYRVSVADCARQRAITFRSLPDSVPSLQKLDLPEQVGGLVQHRSGLVLVAGFFGSGRSTTLAALVKMLGEDEGRHIVTIEDSIEFVHGTSKALVHQQEVGRHVAGAAEGIRQAMATGADTIVVSELQGEAVLDAAVTAAEAGCLVLCGVESGSVVGALSELVIGVQPERRARLRTRMSRVLRGVTAQYLLPRAHRPGRVAVVEVLIASPVVRSTIRKGQFQDLLAIMSRYRGIGMQTTRAALHDLHAAHLISAEDAQLHHSPRADQEEPASGTRSS
ncbi:MAG: Flp pilus assembly complex ATPase component TadA [Planctomycetes bacterium]|nr:Flp pilus assembly complex ATPase component TadA [Planctomycetota bacterium]